MSQKFDIVISYAGVSHNLLRKLRKLGPDIALTIKLNSD